MVRPAPLPVRRSRRYIPTSDDWHPCHDEGLVRVDVLLLTRLWGYPAVRVHVSGAGGMTRVLDLEFSTAARARRAWSLWCERVGRWGLVGVAELEAQGFETG